MGRKTDARISAIEAAVARLVDGMNAMQATLASMQAAPSTPQAVKPSTPQAVKPSTPQAVKPSTPALYPATDGFTPDTVSYAAMRDYACAAKSERAECYAPAFKAVRYQLIGNTKATKADNVRANAIVQAFAQQWKKDAKEGEKAAKAADAPVAKAAKKAEKAEKAADAPVAKAANTGKRSATEGLALKLCNTALACKNEKAARKYLANWTNGQAASLREAARKMALEFFDVALANGATFA